MSFSTAGQGQSEPRGQHRRHTLCFLLEQRGHPAHAATVAISFVTPVFVFRWAGRMGPFSVFGLLGGLRLCCASLWHLSHETKTKTQPYYSYLAFMEYQKCGLSQHLSCGPGCSGIFFKCFKRGKNKESDPKKTSFRPPVPISVCRALWLSGDDEGREAGHLSWIPIYIGCWILCPFCLWVFELGLVRQKPWRNTEGIKHIKVVKKMSNQSDFWLNP